MSGSALKPGLLIVDPDIKTLHALKEFLKDDAYHVVTSVESDPVADIIASHGVKVLMCSEKLSHGSGSALLQKIQAEFPHILSLLIIEEDELVQAERLEENSIIYGFLVKPCYAHDVRMKIRKAMEVSQLSEQNRDLSQTSSSKIKDLEVTYNKIRAMYEAQKDFSSTISHELRTPLASIKMAIDIVMSETTGPLSPDQAEFLSKAKTNIDRLKRLINDILDLTRLEAGKLAMNYQPCEVNHLIKEVAGAHEALVKEKGLSLSYHFTDDLPTIPVDIDKISQVLNNLISNAMKFTEKGSIDIRTVAFEDANHLEICIKDTGIGIAKDDLGKLFRKFQQLGDPSTRKSGGSGLGLAICYEIIRQHGGKIWMESELNEGSTVHFILPIKERRDIQNASIEKNSPHY
ncbi:MAG: hybrid sensor histidine kinase/response regulator [Candidatus Omnitrophica bacterium]|nr:hybrid sensor histidine kinase/response regulator [Candidatus Omnitrophota bacterium]